MEINYIAIINVILRKNQGVNVKQKLLYAIMKRFFKIAYEKLAAEIIFRDISKYDLAQLLNKDIDIISKNKW